MEMNEIVKDIFGPDVFLGPTYKKSNEETVNSSGVSNSLDLVNKYIGSTLLKNAPVGNIEDNRIGRIGPNIVRFDMSTRSGLFSISPDGLSVKARSNSTTARANTAVYKGKWMYEVQLGSKGHMQIGWSTVKCKFNQEFGVGDTINSYAYDGNNVRKWNVAAHKYGEEWFAWDIIGCALDMDNGTIDFYRNGRNLGRAFENISMGPGFAYFPTVSLTQTLGLTANFGSTPMCYPIEEYEPLQAAPKQEIDQAMLLFEWFLKLVKQINTKQNMNEQTMLLDENISMQTFLMCLSSSVLKHVGPLLTMPYITEHVLIPFMQQLSELETDSPSVLSTCLDLLWVLLEEHEMKACLESIVLFLLSTFRHVTSLLEYLNYCKNVLFLIKICQHITTRQYLLQYLLFDQVRLPHFLNVKPPDKRGLADIVNNVWWEMDPVHSRVEANKESYLDACKMIKATISEVETLQVQLLVTLLDNSDGNERRPTSRTIFLKKFKRFVPVANNNPVPCTLCCAFRLLAAFKILWDAEVRTYPVYVPCRVFYDGSIDYLRTERLGGVVSHLNKTYRDELVQRLGPEHEVIVTMGQNQDLSNSYTGLTFVRVINMNLLGQGSSMNFDTTPLRLNSVDATTSLLELLDSIILFYHIVVKKRLAKVVLLRNSMSDYIFAIQDMITRLEEVKKKKDPESLSIQQELSRTIDVFNTKLTDQARHMVWIRAVVYSEENQSQLSWLLKVVTLTLKNASLEGNIFSFVPDFYLEALADLCVGLRNHMHPTAHIEKIPDYRETFISIAEFLCEHFMDSRIVNVNSKTTLLLTLAGFVFNPLTLESLENVPKKSRVKLVTNLLKSYENRAWAESNWILVRFWQGNGFAFRYEKSPHLSSGIGLKLFQQESISQPRKPCPSVVYQGHVRDVLLKNPQDTTTFLNSLLNLLNWTFSEFIGMMQEIHNGSSRPERVFIESRQLKICATCFDLTVSLLRVLEMIITVVPNIFNNSPQSFNENLLFRLCQLLCQVLNRMSSQTSCFQHVVLLEIPDLESVDHFPILTAITGILLALLKEDMTNFKPKSMTEIPKVTQTLLMEPSFQMNTLYLMLGDFKVKNNQAENVKLFSLLNYPNDVTEEEIQKLKEMIEYLDDCRAILPKLKILSDNSDTCTICYAQSIAVTFKPCNHQTCRICIDRHLLNSRSCFFCKAIIEKVVDLSGNILHDFSNKTTTSK
ncbi:E3 ubiquitin-protein ligase RNF123 [Habropoda laboriosa]|uniref:E3 ubiquitin-protein ligase RNF123 n=1 Tax=Habropoda laboriosa TaxID=597456 RepID=A0A0L7QZT7_9HYME|nr:PREDICTED: E3 ubiquitin-protein ligase RNF123-like [Habropoda laboriosa]KOC64134.1 E3 ubiquitin-protein ligase RNF123 [Habropoda laboriosa]